MKTKTSFRELYNFPGFRARARFKCGVKGDPVARVIELVRRQKKASAPFAGDPSGLSGIGESTAYGICPPQRLASIWILNTGASLVRSVV